MYHVDEHVAIYGCVGYESEQATIGVPRAVRVRQARILVDRGARPHPGIQPSPFFRLARSKLAGLGART